MTFFLHTSLLAAETSTGALAPRAATYFMTILRLLARHRRASPAPPTARGPARAARPPAPSSRTTLVHNISTAIQVAGQAADSQTILNAASSRMPRVSYGVM